MFDGFVLSKIIYWKLFSFDLSKEKLEKDACWILGMILWIDIKLNYWIIFLCTQDSVFYVLSLLKRK